MAKKILNGVVSQKGCSGALGLPTGSSNVALLPRVLIAHGGQALRIDVTEHKRKKRKKT